MATLIMHPDAEGDMEKIYRLDRWAWARMVAILQEIEGDDELLEQLNVDFFHREPPGQFDVRIWVEVKQSGRLLYRLKIWDANNFTLPYRIIVAYQQENDEYHVLAIAPRDWDYDINHPLSKRIFRAHDEL